MRGLQRRQWPYLPKPKLHRHRQSGSLSGVVDGAGPHTAPPADDMPMTLGALVEPLAVACHDVRLGEVVPGEKVVVIGGGPIGLLNALVAQHAGAEVRVAEVNAYRLQAAYALGLETVHPLEEDLVAYVESWTKGRGSRRSLRGLRLVGWSRGDD